MAVISGGYGPTNNSAFNQQQQAGGNQNSFNRQQQSVAGTQPRQDYFSFRRQREAAQGNGGSTSASVTVNKTGQGQMTAPPQGIQAQQSPVMANGQMSTQPLTWQSPQQQQFGQLRQQQGTDVSKVPDQYKGVAQSYLTNLGRVGSEPEWQTWLNRQDMDKGIAGSPEAAAYQEFVKQQQRQQFNAPEYIGQMPTNVNTPGINGQGWNPMTSPQLNNPIYNPATFNQQFSQYGFDPSRISQFGAPNQEAIDAQQQQMLQRQFANPHTMGPEAVAALKAKQQETALALQRSQFGDIDSAAAARGTVGSGMQQAAQNQVRNQTGQNILSSYRDIDLQKMQQDRMDETGVLNNANQFQNSQMNRAIGGYGATLSGQQERERGFQSEALSAQQAEAQRAQQMQDNAAQQWQGYQSQANADAQNLGVWGQQNQNYFNLLGQDQNNQQLALQRFLGSQGIGLDRDRLDTQKEQFNKGYGLDIASFLENRRQFDKNLGQTGSNFNNNLAYQYALLNSNSNNNAMDFYRSLFGAV